MAVVAPTSRCRAESSGRVKGELAGPADFTAEWGIEVVALRLTAADNMVDFRYKVVNAEKAAVLFQRENKPQLIHHASGKSLFVPRTAKVGPLRSSNKPEEGRVYWSFFGNRARLVKPGDQVTLVIGDFRAENLTVQ